MTPPRSPLRPFGTHSLRRAGLVALALFLPCLIASAAPPGPARDHTPKLSRDLDAETRNFDAVRPRWSRDIGGVRHIQAIVLSSSADPSMAELRAHVLGLGGSVHAVHVAAHALTVQVKASDLAQFWPSAATSLSVSHRTASTQRTFSTLEAVTGANLASVRSYSQQVGLHRSGRRRRRHCRPRLGCDAQVTSAFKRPRRPARQAQRDDAEQLGRQLDHRRRRRQLAAAGQRRAGWPTRPAIANDTAATPDGYGHGTHVASVAAGRYFTPATATSQQDMNGIAPNARTSTT